MELLLKRKTFTDDSSIGELSINGVFECYTLEDKDRNLVSTMSLKTVNELKVYGGTAIPYGKYEVVISFSERFQKYLPLLVNVIGYEGIRIHEGNTSASTSGCLLPGKTKGVNVVGGSVLAFTALFKKLKAVEKKEKIFITITK